MTLYAVAVTATYTVRVKAETRTQAIEQADNLIAEAVYEGAAGVVWSHEVREVEE